MVTGCTSIDYFNSNLVYGLFSFATEKRKLPANVGIEYSFYNKENPDDYIENGARCNQLQLLYSLDPKKYNHLKLLHMDGGNVEIPSPIHKTYDSIFNFYDRIIKITEKNGLVAWKEGDYCSGGLHFHFDIPNLGLDGLSNFLKELYLDIAERPYLNWIFNEPIDNINANSFFTDNKSYNFIKKLEKNLYFNFNDLLKARFRYKSKPIRFDSQTRTIEYRFFDMVRSKEELVLLVNFVCNYYERMINICSDHYQLNFSKVKSLSITKKNFNSSKKINVDYIDDFKTLLGELNLKFEDYKIFIERNYNVRKKWGKEYLK